MFEFATPVPPFPGFKIPPKLIVDIEPLVVNPVDPPEIVIIPPAGLAGVPSVLNCKEPPGFVLEIVSNPPIFEIEMPTPSVNVESSGAMPVCPTMSCKSEATGKEPIPPLGVPIKTCLLYTSDAADE